MKKDIYTIDGRQCIVYGEEDPKVLLLQPVDEHEAAALDRQAELIKAGLSIPVLMAAFKIEDWNRELSPWNAPAVFGPASFGSGAEETLAFLTDRLLPFVISEYIPCRKIPVVLGGYSLAGFFSLWSTYQTDLFSAAAAVSPSVWFPGWIDYAERSKPGAGFIYLSLGKKEEKTKNKVMASVGNCIRSQQKLLTDQGVANFLEWNEGNHFSEPDVRCAKGFVRCVNFLMNLPEGGERMGSAGE